MEDLAWYASVLIAAVVAFVGGVFLGGRNVPQASIPSVSRRAPLRRQKSQAPASKGGAPPQEDNTAVYGELIEEAKEELLRNVAPDAEGWSVVATKCGITISGKEEGDLNHMRGIAVLPFPADVVVAYLQTENKRSEWDKLVREDRVVERVDEQTVVLYNRFLGVFPVAPRDTCTLAHWFTCEDSSVFGGIRYATCSTSIDHHSVPPANTGGLVRAHLGCGGFVIDPINEESCRIHSYAQIDLKGYIPKSLKKLLGQKQPMCIDKIRQCLEATHPRVSSLATKAQVKKMHPLLERNEIFIACGVHDVLSAKLAERAGFNSLVVSGYAVAASYLGEPDFGILTQTEILDVARRVIRAVNIPVVVDGDTGHGGTLNVIHLVKQLLAMGARGVLLEDQTWPKRCGHMEGKSVVPMEEHVQKIRAAVHARGDDETFMITARTDGRLISLDEAIRRAKAYKDAGADFIFVEAPQTVEEIERIAREVPGPVVINNIEGGKTPILPIERLHELGFMSVGFVLSGIFACAKAMDEVFKHMVEHGSSTGVVDRLMHFDDFTDLVGLPERVALDAQFSASP